MSKFNKLLPLPNIRGYGLKTTVITAKDHRGGSTSVGYNAVRAETNGLAYRFDE